MLSSSFGFATCVIMDVLSMETRCDAPFGYRVLFLGKHYQAHDSPLGCARAKASAVWQHEHPVFYSKHAVPSSSPPRSLQAGRNVSEKTRRNIRGDSPTCRRPTARQSCMEVVCGSSIPPPSLPPAATAVAVRSGSDPHTMISTAWYGYSVYAEMATVLLPPRHASSLQQHAFSILSSCSVRGWGGGGGGSQSAHHSLRWCSRSFIDSGNLDIYRNWFVHFYRRICF